MKTRTIALTLATLFAAVLVAFAAGDLQMGTWKLNEAKSKIPSSARTSAGLVSRASQSRWRCSSC